MFWTNYLRGGKKMNPEISNHHMCARSNTHQFSEIMCGCTADPYYQNNLLVSEIRHFPRHVQTVTYNAFVEENVTIKGRHDKL